MSKPHRPFMGLTWPQICTLRDVAVDANRRNPNRRAIWALSQKSVPLIELYGRGWGLTLEGEEVWLAMQQWRLDLYASTDKGPCDGAFVQDL